MRQKLRIGIGLIVGIGAFLFGQLAIENIAWWWTGNTATFDHPLMNAVKLGLAGSAALAVAASIAMAPARRRRLPEAQLPTSAASADQASGRKSGTDR